MLLGKLITIKLLTSSEVELMETRHVGEAHLATDVLLTSSEVELMETVHDKTAASSTSSDFLGS